MLQLCASKLHYPVCCILCGISRGARTRAERILHDFRWTLRKSAVPGLNAGLKAREGCKISAFWYCGTRASDALVNRTRVCGHMPGQNPSDKGAGTDRSSEIRILLDLIKARRIPTWLPRT
jgi:hypothetical protein